MSDLGRILLVVGVVIAIAGGALMLFGRLQLPGDVTIRSGNLTIYIPIAASVILSILLTIALNLLFRQR